MKPSSVENASPIFGLKRAYAVSIESDLAWVVASLNRIYKTKRSAIKYAMSLRLSGATFIKNVNVTTVYVKEDKNDTRRKSERKSKKVTPAIQRLLAHASSKRDGSAIA